MMKPIDKKKIRIKTYLLIHQTNGVFNIGSAAKLRYSIKDENLIQLVKAMLPFLEGNHTLEDILTRLQPYHEKDKIEEVIEVLYENNLLEVVPEGKPGDFEADEMEMYSRNLLFYDMLAVPGKEAVDYQRELKHSHVAVFGLHGVGAQVLLMLNQTGVGTITGIDSGKVDKYHLNSKILYQYEDVGKDKGEVLIRRIKELNPFTSFAYIDYNQVVKSGRETLREILCKADCVVFCLDVIADVGGLVEEICIPERIPYLFVGKRKNIGFVGPFFLPGKTACPLCDEKLAKKILEYRSSEPGFARRVLSFNKEITFSPIDTLLGNYAVADIVRFLVHLGKPALLNKQFQYDQRYYVLASRSIYRNPRCNNCKEEYEPHRQLLVNISPQLALYDTSVCELADFFHSRQVQGEDSMGTGTDEYTVTIEGRGIRIIVDEHRFTLLLLLRNAYSPKQAIAAMKEIYGNVEIGIVPFLSLLFFAQFILGVDGYKIEQTDLLTYDALYVKLAGFTERKEGDVYCLVSKNNKELCVPEPSMKTIRLFKKGLPVEEVKKEIMRQYDTPTLNMSPLMESLFENGFIEHIRLGGSD